jgi:hypothetical protein
MPRLALVLLLFAGIGLASAQSRDTLAEKYTLLAGSPAAARTLIDGLRDGAEFSLDGTRFAPPTGRMGYGNVDVSLAIARAKLTRDGVPSPTPAQLRATLIGAPGAPGVLALRAQGEAWGQIAHTYGFKLTDVVK